MYDTLLSIASHLCWTRSLKHTHKFTRIGKVFDVTKSVWKIKSIDVSLTFDSIIRPVCFRQSFCSLIAFGVLHEYVFNFLWSLGINHESRQTKENKDALKVILINTQIWYNVYVFVVCDMFKSLSVILICKMLLFLIVSPNSMFDSDSDSNFTVKYSDFQYPYSD